LAGGILLTTGEIDGALLADDVTVVGVADDVLIPPITLFGVLGAGIAGVWEYFTSLDEPYPKPWHTEKKLPSQDPIHSPPQGFDPNNFPNFNKDPYLKWLIRGVAAYQLYDTYKTHVCYLEKQRNAMLFLHGQL
jgi:hypothetical protein